MKNTYVVEGMTCASCAQTIEKAVQKIEGVDVASVNLATEKLSVTYQENVSEEQIKKAVNDAGYGVADQGENQTFALEGMTCASCAQTIEKVVNKLAGVQTASVNLATEKMQARFNPDEISATDIIQAVEDAGYKAILDASETGEKTDKKQAHIKEMWTRVIWSAIFTVPLLYIAMGPMIGLPIPSVLDPVHHADRFAIVQLLLTLPIVYVGRSFYTVGFKALFKGHPNMDSLIAIGTSAAVLQGIVMTYLLATGR